MSHDVESLHYVYIFAHVEGGKLKAPVKVGITKSLNSRLATVQTGSAYKIEIAYAFCFPLRALAQVAEQQFHEEASEFRLAGEWFSMPAYDALWLLTDIVRTMMKEMISEGGDKEAVNALAELSGLHEAMRFVIKRQKASSVEGTLQ